MIAVAWSVANQVTASPSAAKDLAAAFVLAIVLHSCATAKTPDPDVGGILLVVFTAVLVAIVALLVAALT